ncbi:MAG: hypothetical protein ACR2O0_15830 [Rhizobiaceae bacterium]
MPFNMLSIRTAAIVVLSSSAIALTGCASSGSSSSNSGDDKKSGGEKVRQETRATRIEGAEEARKAATRTGEIYLMRGLMDIFSRGIDVMAVQMRREGLYAVNTSYTEWETIGADIVRRNKQKKVSYPIAIVGHSLGANDATKLANYLGTRGIKVSYVASFDPTEPGYVGKNVKKVVNYYLPNENNKIYKRKGFTGKIHNINMSKDPDITHTTIEKNPKLQSQVMGNVMRITRKKRK